MNMKHLLTPLATAVIAATGAQGALAGGAGYPAYTPPPPPQQTIILRGGFSYVKGLSDQVSFVDETFQFADAFRATVDPDDEWGWNLNGVWKPRDHWGFELQYIAGNEHEGGDTKGFFSLIGLDGVEVRDLGEFEPEMSNAFVNWYPLDPSCMFQPYIGFGLTYTDFHDESFTLFRRNDPIVQDLGLRGSLSLGHSWGTAWQVGADLFFGHDSAWLVNVAAIYMDSETDMGFAIFDGAVDGVSTADNLLEAYSGDYRYNPWVFNLNIGYKFSF